MLWLRRRTPRTLRAMALLIVLATWLLIYPGSSESGPWIDFVEALVLTGIIVAIVHDSRRWSGASPSGVKHRSFVLGEIVVAINLAIADFANLYWSMSQRDPDSFSEPLSKIDAAYFAVTTFTNGLGDIHPRTELARLVVTTQMALGYALAVVGLLIIVERARSAHHSAPETTATS